MEKRLNECQDSKGGFAEDRAERYRRGISYNEAKERLSKLLGERGEVMLRNDNDGEEARLSRSSVGKLMSNDAVNKSVGNGFTREQHYAIASDIGNLFKDSLKQYERPDRDGNQDVTIHKYATPLDVGSDVAYITVKESRQHGRRLYTVERVEMGKLVGILEDALEQNSPALFPSTQASLKDKNGTLAGLSAQSDSELSEPRPSSTSFRKDNIGRLVGMLEGAREQSPPTHFPIASPLRDNIAKLQAAVKKKDKNLSDPPTDGFSDTPADVGR